MKKLLSISIFLTGCGEVAREYNEPESASGTKMAKAEKVPTNPAGNTIEQQNIKDRIIMDNKVGSIKHLYIISAYSGQTLIYSTVRGKVTSSGKRLTPSTLDSAYSAGWIEINGSEKPTQEILGEDGTYGSSVEYLYWWSAKGSYHQHYLQGGQILHISDQPIAIKPAIINLEVKSK